MNIKYVDYTVDAFWNDYILHSARNAMGKFIGEILIYPFEIQDNDPTLKLCDHNNILSISEYKNLYAVIGDTFTDYYHEIYRKNEIPLANRSNEFMIPDLQGRYLVERNEDEGFVFTPAAIQSFKLVLNNKFAVMNLWDQTHNTFKSGTENVQRATTTDRPIKSIKYVNMFKDPRHFEGKGANIADKAVNFYMRVK